MKAIDVSNWQGNIDWNAVKGDGVRVAYLKATESKDFKDKSYDRNREEAAKAGIVTGAYDFARPGSQNKGDLVADAQAEAKHFLATANVKAGDLAPALDLEADGGLNKDQLATWVKAWADTVKAATGTTPVIYTSPSFWKGKVGDAAAAGNFRLWIAHWGVNSPDVPTGWQAWSGWQTTSDGHTAGISGRVDQDKVRDPYSLLVGA